MIVSVSLDVEASGIRTVGGERTATLRTSRRLINSETCGGAITSLEITYVDDWRSPYSVSDEFDPAN